MTASKIGVYGMGVMGRNLALNLEDHGNQVSVYNRNFEGEGHIISSFLENEGLEKNFTGAESVPEFVSSIDTPRKILMMVKAGQAVDDVIHELLPHLGEGDILIDGGNSHFIETEERFISLASKNIHYVGMGVSGGEEGARFGPSLMPGTTEDVWVKLKDIIEPIAATDFDGSPCCTRIGSGGAGHFVKMVHNGIEYADMQLISEACHIMKIGLNMSPDEISAKFQEWNNGPLNSYLIEITAEILSVRDKDGEPLIEKILDSAGQKGTGKWTAVTALDLGIPLPGITESVYSRFISSFNDVRQSSSSVLKGPSGVSPLQKHKMLSLLEDALLASRILCHAEGFFMITETDRQKKWGIDPAAVARVWQGGCIIRSKLLVTIAEAFSQNVGRHLLLSPAIVNRLDELQTGWRKCISQVVLHGIPIPVMASSLSLYDSIRSARLPANIVQAQRDYFGAHTYERVDKPRGDFFHTNWKKSTSDKY